MGNIDLRAECWSCRAHTDVNKSSWRNSLKPSTLATTPPPPTGHTSAPPSPTAPPGTQGHYGEGVGALRKRKRATKAIVWCKSVFSPSSPSLPLFFGVCSKCYAEECHPLSRLRKVKGHWGQVKGLREGQCHDLSCTGYLSERFPYVQCFSRVCWCVFCFSEGFVKRVFVCVCVWGFCALPENGKKKTSAISHPWKYELKETDLLKENILITKKKKKSRIEGKIIGY